MAGPQSVGLCGAYDTGAVHPDGLAAVSRFPYLIAELIERGWPESDLAQLTWGNVQRVLRESGVRGTGGRAAPPAVDGEDRTPRHLTGGAGERTQQAHRQNGCPAGSA